MHQNDHSKTLAYRNDRVNVYFHPDITMVRAAQVARTLGCCLVWCGHQFVLRRVRHMPKKHAQSRPFWRLRSPRS